MKEVMELLKAISTRFPNHHLVLRPHPRQKKIAPEVIEGLATLNNSIEQGSDEFLRDVDILIADNSSILLEAALCNCYAIQKTLSANSIYDYYGFIGEGIATFAPDIEETMKLISKFYQQPAQPRQNAVRLDASINSPFEFQVESEILRILKEEYGIVSVPDID